MTSLIDRVLQSRRAIFQGAVIATLIALGINLISSWIADYFKEYSTLLLVTGALFVLIGFLYFSRQLLTERHQSLAIEGVIFLDTEEKRAVSADEYSFSELLGKTLTAAFVENQALKIAWEREMFPESTNTETHNEDGENNGSDQEDEVRYYSIVKMEIGKDDDPVSNQKILTEAIEFCFLDYLSLHLSEYFDQREHDAKKVSILERDSIPHMVLANRILSLLTTPIEDRQIFIKSGMNKNPPKDGEIHAIYGSNGAVYEKFHLSLPIDTTISRPTPGHLVLDNPRFQLNLQVSYRGFTKNLPSYFSDLYLSDSIENIDARLVHIVISANLHPLSFIHLNGWEYYQWIDSFFEYLKNRASFEEFLDRIDWKSVSTRIRAEIIRQRRINRIKEKEEVEAPQPAPSEAIH